MELLTEDRNYERLGWSLGVRLRGNIELIQKWADKFGLGSDFIGVCVSLSEAVDLMTATRSDLAQICSAVQLKLRYGSMTTPQLVKIINRLRNAPNDTLQPIIQELTAEVVGNGINTHGLKEKPAKLPPICMSQHDKPQTIERMTRRRILEHGQILIRKNLSYQGPPLRVKYKPPERSSPIPRVKIHPASSDANDSNTDTQIKEKQQLGVNLQPPIYNGRSLPNSKEPKNYSSKTSESENQQSKVKFRCSSKIIPSDGKNDQPRVKFRSSKYKLQPFDSENEPPKLKLRPSLSNNYPSESENDQPRVKFRPPTSKTYPPESELKQSSGTKIYLSESESEHPRVKFRPPTSKTYAPESELKQLSTAKLYLSESETEHPRVKFRPPTSKTYAIESELKQSSATKLYLSESESEHPRVKFRPPTSKTYLSESELKQSSATKLYLSESESEHPRVKFRPTPIKIYPSESESEQAKPNLRSSAFRAHLSESENELPRIKLFPRKTRSLESENGQPRVKFRFPLSESESDPPKVKFEPTPVKPKTENGKEEHRIKFRLSPVKFLPSESENEQPKVKLQPSPIKIYSYESEMEQLDAKFRPSAMKFCPSESESELPKFKLRSSKFILQPSESESEQPRVKFQPYPVKIYPSESDNEQPRVKCQSSTIQIHPSGIENEESGVKLQTPLAKPSIMKTQASSEPRVNGYESPSVRFEPSSYKNRSTESEGEAKTIRFKTSTVKSQSYNIKETVTSKKYEKQEKVNQPDTAKQAIDTPAVPQVRFVTDYAPESTQCTTTAAKQATLPKRSKSKKSDKRGDKKSSKKNVQSKEAEPEEKAEKKSERKSELKTEVTAELKAETKTELRIGKKSVIEPVMESKMRYEKKSVMKYEKKYDKKSRIEYEKKSVTEYEKKSRVEYIKKCDFSSHRYPMSDKTTVQKTLMLKPHGERLGAFITCATESNLKESGLYIMEVRKNSVADAAGCLRGDRIIAVSSKSLLSCDYDTAIDMMRKAGDEYAITIIREKQDQRVKFNETLTHQSRSKSMEFVSKSISKYGKSSTTDYFNRVPASKYQPYASKYEPFRSTIEPYKPKVYATSSLPSLGKLKTYANRNRISSSSDVTGLSASRESLYKPWKTSERKPEKKIEKNNEVSSSLPVTKSDKGLVEKTLKLRPNGERLGVSIIWGMETSLKKAGLFIHSVHQNSAADVAGCISGDRIIAINSKSLLSCNYQSAVEMMKSAGNEFNLTLLRAQKSTMRKHITEILETEMDK